MSWLIVEWQHKRFKGSINSSSSSCFDALAGKLLVLLLLGQGVETGGRVCRIHGGHELTKCMQQTIHGTSRRGSGGDIEGEPQEQRYMKEGLEKSDNPEEDDLFYNLV